MQLIAILLEQPECVARDLFLPPLSAVLAEHEGDDQDGHEEDGRYSQRHQDDRLEPHRDLPVVRPRTVTL